MATTFDLPLPIPRGDSNAPDISDADLESACRHVQEWNPGVLSCQLLQWNVRPRYHDIGSLLPPPNLGGGARGPGDILRKLPKLQDMDLYGAWPLSEPMEKASYDNTQKAMSGVFKQVLHKFDSYFDLIQIEPYLPVKFDIKQRQEIWTWSEAGGYPPHLAILPPGEQYTDLFNASRLAGVRSCLAQVIPKELTDLDPSRGTTLSENAAYNQELVREKKNIYINQNVGTRTTPPAPEKPKKEDWYTDFVFAQQNFTGTNPTTIRAASSEWVAKFREEAKKQGNNDMVKTIDEAAKAHALYIQDYSNFRAQVGADPSEILTSNASLPFDAGTKKDRWAVAPVALFNLPASDGILHPLAIVIDYKKNIASSVTIFNKRCTSSATNVDQATDWPWRYAKTCIQVADWHKHELIVHLALTHLLEEAVIVAGHRSFEDNHPVFRLLKPHWFKTLAINAGARAILMPLIINNIAGIKPEYLLKLVNSEYTNFDWTQRYIPNDLPARGFPLQKLAAGDKQFNNYAYGRNMIYMWQTLRKFVKSFLDAFPQLDTDAKVANDSSIRCWVQEMHENAKLASFPNIKTRDELIDTVTMCIHLASPQHTAVNYLQEYYQTFVINKPPSFFEAPPTTLDALMKTDEALLVKSLPMNQLRQWLLAAQLPHLLNETVATKENLPTYALTLMQTAPELPVSKAAMTLWFDLKLLSKVFEHVSGQMHPETGGYKVMQPEVTAVSVLI